jgi:hypothetical protein
VPARIWRGFMEPAVRPWPARPLPTPSLARLTARRTARR